MSENCVIRSLIRVVPLYCLSQIFKGTFSESFSHIISKEDFVEKYDKSPTLYKIALENALIQFCRNNKIAFAFCSFEINCVCNMICTSDNALSECILCSKKQHQSCLLNNTSLKRYYCTNCILDNLDLLQRTETILVAPIPIIYNSSQFEKIKESGTFYCSPLLSKFNCRLVIRCIGFNQDYTHHWPDEGRIFLNKSLIYNIPMKNELYKRNEKVFEVISGIKYSEKNEIYIEINNETKNSFTAGLFMVSEMNIQEIINNALRHRNDLISSFKLYLPEFEGTIYIINDEKAEPNQLKSSTEIKIHLTCPITSTRMKYPARGINCQKHIRSFDLLNFLEGNKLERKFKCPICNTKIIRFFIDSYLYEIINILNQSDLNCKKIKVQKNSDFKAKSNYYKYDNVNQKFQILIEEEVR